MPWFLLVSFVASASLVQDRDPRLWTRLPAVVAGRVQTLADSAARLRLPVEPLVQKALEGRSKGAPDERIVAAVAALLGALERSRTALGATSAEPEVVAGAEWLRAGGSASRLSGLRMAAPSRQLAVAIATGTDLMTRGWPEAEAGQATDRLLAAKATDRDFLALRSRIEQAVRLGGTPMEAVLSEFRRLETGNKSP